jgi:hypothetical protein
MFVGLALVGCASIQSPPMIVNHNVQSTSAFTEDWVRRTFRQQATMFGGDAVAYEHIPEGADSSRIELRWAAPDIHTRVVFAVIHIRRAHDSRVEVTVTEEKSSVPLTHRFQDVATKLQAEFDRAGFLVR